MQLYIKYECSQWRETNVFLNIGFVKQTIHRNFTNLNTLDWSQNKILFFWGSHKTCAWFQDGNETFNKRSLGWSPLQQHYLFGLTHKALHWLVLHWLMPQVIIFHTNSIWVVACVLLSFSNWKWKKSWIMMCWWEWERLSGTELNFDFTDV